jgi:hypothetical protein
MNYNIIKHKIFKGNIYLIAKINSDLK